VVLSALETIKVVPVGTTKVQSMLQVAAHACVQGGVTETFTPMYIFAARKPKDASGSSRTSRV